MMSVPTNSGQFDSTLSQRIRRHWKLFLTAFAVMFALITCVVLLLPTKYESQMKLFVNTERQDLVITPSEDKNGAYYQELAEVRINSEIELLKSNDVLKQVVIKAGLLKKPGAKIADGSPSPLELDKAVHSLEHHLVIEPVKKSAIISVSYIARSPELANTVLKNLAEAYLGQHLKAHATPGSFVFFSEQTNAYAKRLAESENQLRLFRQEHAALLDPDEKDPLTQRVIEAQAALDDTESQEAEFRKRVQAGQAALAQMDRRVTSQVRVSPQAVLIAQLSAMVAELENRRTEMITKFKPDDRLVKELDKEIADTEAALKSATANSSVEQVSDLNAVREDAEKNLVTSEVTLAGLRARRASMVPLVKGYKGQMYRLATAATDNDRLARAVKEDEENYLLYSKRREEARIAESLDQKRITDVTLAEVPTLQLEPVSPVIPMDLAIGALLSAMIAYLCVRAREHFNSPRPVDNRFSHTTSLAA